MPILYAELQIAGRQVACDVASFSFAQATDEKGRPSSVVRVGLLQVIISGEAAGWHLWEEIKFDPFRRESGHLVFFRNEGITARRYTFYDAALVSLTFHYAGTGSANRQTATQVELHFSAATIALDGIRLEAHSLIPWDTDAQTSFRALTQPPAPQPSAHLAAGLGLLAVRKAAELTPEILLKAPPIAFEGAARVVTLLPGLLLAPVNGHADPAKDYDWQLYHRNHTQQPAIPPPPPPDKVRLAQLERALEAHSLTSAEEAELVILLAKVKGIFINQLADLTLTQRAAVRPPVLDPKKKPLYAPVIKKWYDKGGTIEVMGNGNWKYIDWEGNYVIYEGDEPNFDHFARQQVDIEGMIGDCDADFAKANAEAPEGPILESNTWHHKQNMRTMQEVDYGIHRRFTHYGARYLLKQQKNSTPTKPTPSSAPTTKRVLRKRQP